MVQGKKKSKQTQNKKWSGKFTDHNIKHCSCELYYHNCESYVWCDSLRAESEWLHYSARTPDLCLAYGEPEVGGDLE